MGGNDDDQRQAQALARFQVISAYLALEPARGQRNGLLEQLAARTWTGADGEAFRVAGETIRSWVRRYRLHGLAGLADKPRPVRGVQVLSREQIDLACRLKEEVPERSLDRLLRIMEDMKLVQPGTVRRSTLHRALKERGLSARRCRIPHTEDLDRFEAALPNNLWQSDMLEGPWLPDPARPGKSRRAHLYAFIDDHSRLLLHGRFSFKGDLPALELVFRRCLQKFGQPRRVYYDNGQVYRSNHMRRVVAELGIHRIIFTEKGRPMGHGKIEAFNRLVRSAFLAELKPARITTLDQVNEAFVAWADMEYNAQVHGETGERPLDRWRAGHAHVKRSEEHTSELQSRLPI
jgi:putative transposase